MNILCFNPTIVEFEQVKVKFLTRTIHSFNPTIVEFELKRGINKQTRRDSFNPTIVEFEQSPYDTFVAYYKSVLILP